MVAEATEGARMLGGIRGPLAAAIAIVVSLAWSVTWATSDLTMVLLGMGPSTGFGDVAAFFAILVVMMVAMMLPSALPMILAFHGMTRLEAGRPVLRADVAATALFTSSYFLVWGAFAVLALLGLMAFGLAGPLAGPLAFAPAFVLLAAGGYQLTRPKEVCLTHCQAPMGFMMTYWRSGRSGALRMGLHHAGYCLGCCWLFMIALFVAGSMSLLWMGALSAVIFVEKVAVRTMTISRAVGVLLLVLGGILVVRGVLGA